MSKWDKFKIVGRIAAGIVGTIVPGVAKIEQLAETIGSMRGKAKQDAVVELVKASLEAAEGLSERDLLNDPQAEAATRAVIDAVVNLHNVLAKRQPAAFMPATAAQLGTPHGSTGE